RRLRHHQHGGGRRFGNAADVDLRHRPPRSESGHQRDFGSHSGVLRRAGASFGAAAGGPAVRRRSFFLGLSGLAGCTLDSRPRLNVYNWSNYVAPDTVSNFEREFGVAVRYGVYESNEEMLAKALSGNSGWDVVFPSNYLIRPMRVNALLAPTHHEWVRKSNHLDARFE